MNRILYMAIDYRHANNKMRSLAVEISPSYNFKKVIDENVYIKNAFYILVCDSQKEMNETVEAWNNNHKNNNRLMSWDELTEVIK